MNYRGYLKDSGGAKRLRFVMPGFNADDENVPPNKVIFDSNSVVALSIINYGKYQFNNTQNTNEIKIASWNFDFVPLCYFWSKVSVAYSDGYSFQPFLTLYSGSPWMDTESNYIKVKKDGIYIKVQRVNSTNVTLEWVAFNIAVR